MTNELTTIKDPIDNLLLEKYHEETDMAITICDSQRKSEEWAHLRGPTEFELEWERV